MGYDKRTPKVKTQGHLFMNVGRLTMDEYDWKEIFYACPNTCSST